MLNRRLILTGLLSGFAAVPAFAQGKKGSGDSGSVSAASPLRGIDGTYIATGRNPDGSEYKGQCYVTQQSDVVEFTWVIGSDNNENRGVGTISGRVVTVDWGDEHPVIYVIMDNGELHGTWANGTAFERLIPR